MILANLGRAATTAALILVPSWPVLLVVAALRAAVDSAYTPAKQAALQAASDDASLTRANQISTAINQLSKVLAPGLGGALLIVVAPAQVFLINAALSLIAALLLLRFPARVREAAAPQGTFAGLREAVALMRSTPPLRFAVAAMGLVIFANFLFDTLIPLHLRSLTLPASAVGYFMSAVGLGTVLGALAPMRDAQLVSWILAGSALAGALTIALGLAGIHDWPVDLPILLGGAFCVGLASGRIFVPLRIMTQKHTPPSQMARVSALSEAINTGALLTAPLIGAAIAQHSSTGWSFVAGGLAFLALAPLLRAMKRRA